MMEWRIRDSKKVIRPLDVFMYLDTIGQRLMRRLHEEGRIGDAYREGDKEIYEYDRKD